MRLIDSDALKEQVESHVVSMSVCLSMDEHYGKVTMREDCLEDITNAPTIDAMPVEWLKERKHWAAIDGDHWAENIIRYLLDAWQKEQEAQK